MSSPGPPEPQASSPEPVVEVTARSAIRDYQTFRNALHQLKSMGFQIAIDDCGARSAESIGASTIAEAIETEEQLRVTRELGISQGQGFLFAAPAPWEMIRNWQHGTALA